MWLLVAVALVLGAVSLRLLPEMRAHAAQCRAERKGDICFQGGAFNRAGEIWSGLLDENPGAVSVRNKLAVLCMREGRFEDARAVLADGIRQDPETVSFRFNLALLAYMEGDCGGALAALSEVERLSPAQADVHHLKALVYERMGQGELARQEFVKELNIDPATPAAWARVAGFAWGDDTLGQSKAFGRWEEEP